MLVMIHVLIPCILLVVALAWEETLPLETRLGARAIWLLPLM
jgi:hypothetical protein